MAFVSIRASVHIGRLGTTESPFTADVPAQHPARLQYCSIDEGFALSRPQLPPREAVAEIVLIEDREAYESRRIQAEDFVVIQDTEDGGAPVVRFRGRAYAPEVEDRQRGRVEIRIRAHGLWQRLIRLPEVTVPAIQNATGKQSVDSVLDQAQWPTSFRDVPTPPTGANSLYQEWAFEGKPHLGVAAALAGINPRSKHWVDATGRLRVRWLSPSLNLKQFQQREVRPDLRFNETERHLINQVLAPDVDVSRVATTRWTSTTPFELADDEDTVIYQDVVTFADSAEDASWSYQFRHDNGNYFGTHPNVAASLTVSYVPGTAYSFNVVLTARAKSGSYTTSTNFFRIQDILVTVAAGSGAPQIFNLDNVAADEPRTLILPALAYADDVPETLANNYLTLWGRTFEFAAFSVAMADTAVVAKVRDLELWERMSVSDGNDTHFGFCVRRIIEYVHPRPVVRIAMMEDFTEGGDISVPFRPPFEWVFNSIAALDMFFDRASSLSNRGAWRADPNGGSTPSGGTGPRPNNALAYVHTETSGGSQGSHEDNGVLTLEDDHFSDLRQRDVVLRYCAQGDFAAGDGLVVQGRTVSASSVQDLIIGENGVEELWRINRSDPDDVQSPYGSLGVAPATTTGIGAIAVAPNGDFIVVHNRNVYRLNPSNPSDETGDYGLIGIAPQEGFGADIDANGDLIITGGNRPAYLRRVSLANPPLNTGIYVNLGNLPTGSPVEFYTGTGLALNANGDAYVIEQRTGFASLWLINVSNPGDTSGGYGYLGNLPSGLNNPRACAIDADGDLWVADRITRQLWKIDTEDPDRATGGYGNQGTLPGGIADVGGATMATRTIISYGEWTDIVTLPASAYPASDAAAEEGDTLTDVEGAAYTVVADGGWRDYTVSIPNIYQEIRLRPALNAGGNAAQQDIALHSIRSA